ncbi:hypothetical protein DPMN_041405 [Dreissena polymorpha]|uniref:Uncharacterized protein n=1 Tax=Dreissena polymorpha TaxID=45954 RepID=A0A9D4CYZ9_DREPO|nr:hypothetical protein DPMN_041405 [Dreissena polymorpha]
MARRGHPSRTNPRSAPGRLNKFLGKALNPARVLASPVHEFLHPEVSGLEGTEETCGRAVAVSRRTFGSPASLGIAQS